MITFAKGLFRVVTWLTVVGLFIASCAPIGVPTLTPKQAPAPSKAEGPAAKPPAVAGIPSPSPQTTAPQPKYGGVLPASIPSDMPSLDPHQETISSTLTLAQAAMNGLIEFDPGDPSWKVRPGLAESWEVSKDGTKLTFHLRKGVNWHDGKPFTSEDAKFSLERAGFKPPKGATSPRAKAFEPVETIEVLDQYDLVLTLKYPYAEIIDFLASGYNLMLPKHIIEPLGGAKIKKEEHAIGTGPFKVKSYDSGVGWHLIKNPNYFKKGLPHLNEIRYYIIKDNATRFSAFRTKAVLLSDKLLGLSPPQKEALEKGPEAGQVVITGGPTTSLMALWMNTRHPGPIGDVRVRKAIDLAIDRQKVQKLLANTQHPGVIAGVIYPGSKFAIPEQAIKETPGFRQPKDADIAEAKRLLAEVKLQRDFTLPLIIREEAVYRDVGSVLIEELKPLGIAATLKVLDIASFYEAQERRNFAATPTAYGPWSPSPHYALGDRFITGAGRNYEGVSDERLDSLFIKQARSLDPEERKKIFWEMERILREEIVPVATLYYVTRFQGYWKQVKGHPGLGLGVYEGHRMEEVWLEK